MMMTEKLGPVLGRLALILLICLLGTALLTAHAADHNMPASPGFLQQEAAAVNQTCYTLDTARPEWLGNYTVIYLPTILKGYGP